MRSFGWDCVFLSRSTPVAGVLPPFDAVSGAPLQMTIGRASENNQHNYQLLLTHLSAQNLGRTQCIESTSFSAGFRWRWLHCLYKHPHKRHRTRHLPRNLVGNTECYSSPTFYQPTKTPITRHKSPPPKKNSMNSDARDGNTPTQCTGRKSSSVPSDRLVDPACFKLGAEHKKLQTKRSCMGHTEPVKRRTEVSWTGGPRVETSRATLLIWVCWRVKHGRPKATARGTQRYPAHV